MNTAVTMQHARPYPGMRPFEQDEADLFFGQQVQIDALVERLGRSRLIAILGESGCGKSSLVKAGLLPRLLGRRRDPSVSLWRIAVSRPGRSPVSNLAEQLSLSVTGTSREATESILRSGSFGLVEAVRQAGLPRGRRVLIVIDQFEELFRFSGVTAGTESGSLDEAALFVKLLVGVIEAAADARGDVPPIYVVLTMRSEYLGDCSSFFGLAEAINDGTYLVPKMTRSDVEDAITRPLESYGATVDNDLLQRLLNETESAQQDGLPLLQHALRRLWDRAAKRGTPVRLMLSDFDLPADGNTPGRLGLEAHLDHHLEEILSSLPTPRQQTVERLFRQLGEYDTKGRLIRRSCDLPTLAAVCEVTPEEALGVASVFRDEEHGRTFLMPPQSPSRDAALLSGAELLDISHEALLRRWPRLCRWVEQESKDADEYRALAEREYRGGDVLRGPELSRVRHWVRTFRPTEAWSRRYRGPLVLPDRNRHRYEFAPAMEYLERSIRATQVRRWLLVITALVLACALGYGYILIERDQDRARLETINRELARKQDQLTATLGERDRALNRNNELLQKETEQRERADAATRVAQEQSRIATEQSTIARKQSEIAGEKERIATEKSIDAQRQAEYAKKQELAATEAKGQLELKTAELEKQGRELATAKAAVDRDIERRKADEAFNNLVRASNNYDPVQARRTLDQLLSTCAKYLADYGMLPLGGPVAIVRGLGMARVLANDEKRDDPVLLAVADPTHPGSVLPIRKSSILKDSMSYVHRHSWTMQRAIGMPPEDSPVIGGEGGYVLLPIRPGNATPGKQWQGRKLHPFALTGLGFTTDGEWVATGSAVGDMRLFRTEELMNGTGFKNRLFQFVNASKLVVFLMGHRYLGDYSVREFALSVPKTGTGDRTKVTVVAVTDSGRLLLWNHPGPFGKQISGADKLALGPRETVFTSVSTNPATQEIWASAGSDVYRIVRGTLEKVSAITGVPGRTGGVGTSISAMSWNPDGTILAVGLRDGNVLLGDGKASFRIPVVIPAHNSAVTTMTWSGTTLGTGSNDGSARLWRCDVQREDRDIVSHGLMNEMPSHEQILRLAEQVRGRLGSGVRH